MFLEFKVRLANRQEGLCKQCHLKSKLSVTLEWCPGYGRNVLTAHEMARRSCSASDRTLL